MPEVLFLQHGLPGNFPIFLSLLRRDELRSGTALKAFQTYSRCTSNPNISPRGRGKWCRDAYAQGIQRFPNGIPRPAPFHTAISLSLPCGRDWRSRQNKREISNETQQKSQRSHTVYVIGGAKASRPYGPRSTPHGRTKTARASTCSLAAFP